MSPLLHSNLQHLSLQLFCFPSSLIPLTPPPLHPLLGLCRQDAQQQWWGCIITVAQANEGRAREGMRRRIAGLPLHRHRHYHHHPPPSLAPHIRLPCKVHSAAHGPCSPVTSCSLRLSMCHCGAAYTLWHCSTPTGDNIALQRARLYWFVWEFITRVPALSPSLSSSIVCVCADTFVDTVSLTCHK